MPRVARKVMDAVEQEMATREPRDLKSTGDASEALGPEVIVPADRMPNKNKLNALHMSDQVVEIMVHETTDKNANQLPDIYVNGVGQRFIRGQTQAVKWKFVELLARCRETTYTQQKYRDDDGNEGYRNVPHTALKYPFSLVNAAPRFHDRLKAVMGEV